MKADVYYDLAKVAVNRLAFSQGHELAPHGATAGEAEVGDNLVALIVTYLRGLPSPRVSQASTGTEHGAAIFAEIGCAACHTPQQPAQATDGAAQWFSPYTDLLVHDMGDGLADRTADGSISVAQGAREWRTAPLWGLGARAAELLGMGRTTLWRKIREHGIDVSHPNADR